MNQVEWCITSHVVLPFSLSFPSDKYNTAITSAITTRECTATHFLRRKQVHFNLKFYHLPKVTEFKPEF